MRLVGVLNATAVVDKLIALVQVEATCKLITAIANNPYPASVEDHN